MFFFLHCLDKVHGTLLTLARLASKATCASPIPVVAARLTKRRRPSLHMKIALVFNCKENVHELQLKRNKTEEKKIKLCNERAKN